ncbi:MAG: universal stress protein [Chloroflexi bacterium]|nr:universal stress protein [Chloroflexota bacterium]
MFNDILVPLDGSELSERALPMAQNLAQSSDATVHLIHMVSREHELGAGRGIESVQAAELEIDMARRLTEGQLHRGRNYLEQISSQLRDAGIKFETEFTVKAGDPAQNIIEYAKKHSISLVVMATHGHGGLRRLLLVSVTDRVIRSCEVPVLVVPCS